MGLRAFAIGRACLEPPEYYYSQPLTIGTVCSRSVRSIASEPTFSEPTPVPTQNCLWNPWNRGTLRAKLLRSVQQLLSWQFVRSIRYRRHSYFRREPHRQPLGRDLPGHQRRRVCLDQRYIRGPNSWPEPQNDPTGVIQPMVYL